MWIKQITISRFRGIVDFTLDVDGTNLVVWGDNGCGKSGIVDGLDFLLTGDVHRLIGEGTGSSNLNTHGVHVKHDPSEAFVEALLAFQDGSQLRVRRALSTPKEFQLLGGAGPSSERAKKTLAEAKQIPPILTRRELLRFVNAKPSGRLAQMAELLKLNNVEEARKAVQRCLGTIEHELQEGRDRLESESTRLRALLHLPTGSAESVILEKINGARKLLQLSTLDSLSSDLIGADLTALPASLEESRPSREALTSTIDRITTMLGTQQAHHRLAIAVGLCNRLAAVKGNHALEHALNKEALTAQGLELLSDDENHCPLCEVAWPKGELRLKLEADLKLGSEANDIRKQLHEESRLLIDEIDALGVHLDQLADGTNKIDLSDQHQALMRWRLNLKNLKTALGDPLASIDFPTAETLSNLYAPSDIDEVVQQISAAIRQDVVPGEAQRDARNLLRTVTLQLQLVEESSRAVERAASSQVRAQALNDGFSAARDKTLTEIYTSVESRFVELYQILHPDETDFQASLPSKKAGVGLEVAFHDCGLHPPHSLHSEGHQDSMGLCLFLALTESAMRDCRVTVLDDVLTSVDAGHRKKVSEMLRDQFANWQFLITTHDRVWAEHLRRFNFVGAANWIHIRGWSLAEGPQWSRGSDLWEKVAEELSRDDVSGAGGRLRRGLEQHFQNYCAALRVPVRYDAENSHTLGDLAKPAVASLKKKLKKALNAAESYQNKQAIELLKAKLERFEDAATRAGSEEWELNAATHFNEWANLTKGEVTSLAKAYEDLTGEFLCPTGTCSIEVVFVSGREQLGCSCTAASWTLTAKAEASKAS